MWVLWKYSAKGRVTESCGWCLGLRGGLSLVNAPLPLASDPVEREERFLQVDVIKNASSVFEDRFLVHKFCQNLHKLLAYRVQLFLKLGCWGFLMVYLHCWEASRWCSFQFCCLSFEVTTPKLKMLIFSCLLLLLWDKCADVELLPLS